jgi:hypothetical protein
LLAELGLIAETFMRFFLTFVVTVVILGAFVDPLWAPEPALLTQPGSKCATTAAVGESLAGEQKRIRREKAMLLRQDRISTQNAAGQSNQSGLNAATLKNDSLKVRGVIAPPQKGSPNKMDSLTARGVIAPPQNSLNTRGVIAPPQRGMPTR